MERPQSVWPRKAFFQVHLWTGTLACLYVIAVSVSGSAIVFLQEIEKRAHRIMETTAGRTPLTTEEVWRRAEQSYPSRELLEVIEPRKPGEPYAVVLATGGRRAERLFDPYTGADLGDPRRLASRVLDWLADLHDNLLLGLTGRMLNGLGALLLLLMSLTGPVLWWPGIKNWRRSIRVKWSARPARLNWDLHSAVGFWCYLFVLIWGISGIQLCFPGTLDFALNGHVRYWVTALHFGRFNAVTKGIWTGAGLVPGVLAVTGGLMWWNRVLSKKVKRLRVRKTSAASAGGSPLVVKSVRSEF